MKKIAVLLAVLVLAVLLVPRSGSAREWVGTIPSVEFPEGLDWINTDEPLTLLELRGRIVLLDFWTYGCINCVHVIPDLAALQEKYAEELVVIGVHSAKFSNEAVTENIALIAERYGRNEPIVNDLDFEIWRSYNMNAWPGFIIIDPEGRVVGRQSGEGIYDLFDEVISSMIVTFEERGTLERQPLSFRSGAVVRPRTALRFPGKVLADAASERLFIADSGNNRIVVTDLSGTVLRVIGNGSPELRDGTFAEASFRAPQGLSLGPAGVLYVADTGNHSIRAVDLSAGTVTTVAGHGRQEYMFGLTEVDGLVHGLNSPWDVLWLDGTLFIAMAGQHQVWTLDPASGRIELFAGSGREQLTDGPLRSAGLNQPSGLATDGEYLYIADAEASAIRRADLDPAGELVTLVGTGLFDFGDVDGVGAEVRLQHPKGVAWWEGGVYIADTYNHSVKRLVPEELRVRRVVGEGMAGYGNGSGLHTAFFEPGGLSFADRLLFIADTNNHVIRQVDMDTAVVSTVQLTDPEALLVRRPAGASVFDETISLAPVAIPAAGAELRLNLSLPAGYIANHLAPLSAEVSLEETGLLNSVVLTEPEYPLSLELGTVMADGPDELLVDVTVYYCENTNTQLCLIRQVRLVQPLTVAAADGVQGVELNWQPPPLP